MDPNTILERLRELCNAFVKSEDDSMHSEILDNMCADFDALDKWLSKGGFKPAAWEHKA